jgi:hypothetical protein
MGNTRIRLATLTLAGVISLLTVQYPAGAMTSVHAAYTVLR